MSSIYRFNVNSWAAKSIVNYSEDKEKPLISGEISGDLVAGPDLNRRPTGYESVSAAIPWMDCTIRHGLDDISAQSGRFRPVLSNWCANVFLVVGQNVGQGTKRGFYLHTSFDSEKKFQVVILYIHLYAEMPTHSSTRFGEITLKNNATLRILYWCYCFLSVPNLYKPVFHMV